MFFTDGRSGVAAQRKAALCLTRRQTAQAAMSGASAGIIPVLIMTFGFLLIPTEVLQHLLSFSKIITIPEERAAEFIERYYQIDRSLFRKYMRFMLEFDHDKMVWRLVSYLTGEKKENAPTATLIIFLASHGSFTGTVAKLLDSLP